MADSMSDVLKKVNLYSYIGIFEEQKISLDIVCKLSLYDFQCLGLVNRSDGMRLRIECVKYGSCQPDLVSNHLGHHEFNIPKITIEALLDTGFKVMDISNTLSVSKSTIYRRMRQYNLSRFDFSDVSDETLDFSVNEIIREFPHCGEAMIRQILFHKNIKVPRSQLRDSLQHLDETGIQNRSRRRLHRRVYNVAGPNHLWHVDTNHKLIRWHFVIVGGIDGFSRFITFFEYTDNNKAETLLNFFLRGVEELGVPLRVRSDKGMENTKIADYMIKARGENRGSMITGKSTHNQRTECLWRDVYEGILSYYYDLFYFMEDEEILDIMNGVHIFALHHVLLSKINGKLNIWRNAWAKHRVRTVRSSPIRLYMAGLMNNPIDSPLADVENYGVEGTIVFDAAEDNPRPIFVRQSITNEERFQQELNLKCPNNWTSSNYGIDIYIEAVRIVEHYTNNTTESSVN